jgi:hypothetical protein
MDFVNNWVKTDHFDDTLSKLRKEISETSDGLRSQITEVTERLEQLESETRTTVVLNFPSWKSSDDEVPGFTTHRPDPNIWNLTVTSVSSRSVTGSIIAPLTDVTIRSTLSTSASCKSVNRLPAVNHAFHRAPYAGELFVSPCSVALP